MFKLIFFIVLPLFSAPAWAQVADSMVTSRQLKEVTVRGYISKQPYLTTPASVAILNAAQLQSQAEESLLPALNTLPGVRLEERSPGSYRLSLRGSLLRSPFGVRNVKVYIDDFPLTDAGGNTYLNLLDPRSIQRLEILKGPDGSLFGANSGGVVLLDLIGQSTANTEGAVRVSSGSYGLVHENIALQKQHSQGQFNFQQGFQRSDGYRENTAMRRHYLQAAEKWQYNRKNQLRFFSFYSDLKYETPGGLTLAQFQENPRQARPAAGPNPGAAEQKARIENKTLFGGISHEAQLTARLRQVVALFGSHTNYLNPFITNYETRQEGNYGMRTYLEWTSLPTKPLSWKWNLGLEGQQARQQITNAVNNRGEKGIRQASDKLTARQAFYFTRFTTTIFQKVTAEAAVSLNYFALKYRGYRYDKLDFPADTLAGNKTFSPTWMPRVAVSYAINPSLAWRASASRGYSPPTIAEIRPSNTLINPQLAAENGWNYETGFRYSPARNRFQADVSVFNFQLQQAIARRVEEGGAEYFVNAGGTNQSGVEALFHAWLLPYREKGWVRSLQWNNSYTYSHFRFVDYKSNEDDFSGNQLTGVPQHVWVSGLVARLPFSLQVAAQYTYTDRLPLNDANSAFADSYHLVQAKVSWEKPLSDQNRLDAFAGADNLLNQSYSLGNDINAFGGRFYNPAPLRNFYIGLSLAFR
ncbi:MAG: TonB-dependent receptor [uncultured Adhaeribacter sp.]|uniref:TonB-dependent receptor n=1 Tax=uncultured Adhaeribacter sp. TaxID=448109 RepID=A0A6J4IXT3_9BACT|nr:MAG: TonB-dependent receptor [uncultured Adhaeribacter sp.]